MMGDLDRPQFNHLLPHVLARPLPEFTLRSPNGGDVGGRKERKKNSVYQLEFSWKILGAQVIRNGLVTTVRTEGKWLGQSTGQRGAAAYSETVHQLLLCPEPVLKRGQFLYVIMVESQADRCASPKRLKQPYLHLLPEETRLHLRLGGWETVPPDGCWPLAL